MKLTEQQARAVSCPSCGAEPGHPCQRQRVAHKPEHGNRPLPRVHYTRRRALAELERARLGLDRRCPDCGAAADEPCTHQSGTPLQTTHAARRTVELPFARASEVLTVSRYGAGPARTMTAADRATAARELLAGMCRRYPTVVQLLRSTVRP